MSREQIAKVINSDPADRMIDRAEFERIVGQKPGWAYRREERGQDMPPRYKLGRSVKYRLSEVNAWIELHRVATAVA